MISYKNPQSNHVRKLVTEHRSVIDYALSVWKEFYGWPKYRAIATRFNIPIPKARNLVEIAKLAVEDPDQYQAIITLPPPLPSRAPRIEQVRFNKSPTLRFDTSHVEGDSLVYFVLCPKYDVVKIGCTTKKRLISRVAQLQIGCWVPFQLTAVMPGMQSEERALHKRFTNLRIRGEWFYYKEPLISYIESIKPK